MQATVSSFSAETGCGSVLLDDGTRLCFDSPAFAASGLRRLRVGQRVRLELQENAGARQISRVTMATTPP